MVIQLMTSLKLFPYPVHTLAHSSGVLPESVEIEGTYKLKIRRTVILSRKQTPAFVETFLYD